MKKIETLVPDIYECLEGGAEVSPDDAEQFGKSMADLISSRLKKREAGSYLRLSNLGAPCERKLYYSIKSPEKGDKLDGQTLLKFLIGDVWETVLLFLAKAAGHEVTHEQKEVSVEGVSGHMDAVIDGMVVDVKSASTRAFMKFEKSLTKDEDAFGYLTQLDAYVEAVQDDPSVTEKSRAAFLAGDKTLGRLALDIQPRQGIDYKVKVPRIKKMLEQDTPPPRGFDDEPDGYYKGKGFDRTLITNGNRKLGVNCSYCAFKEECWPGLRTYVYSSGPVFLTKVVKEPKVAEASVDKF